MAGMTGAEIYENFHAGAGPAGLVGGTAIVQEVAASYESRAARFRELVALMESAWQGDAAEAARRGAGPVAVEHELSGFALGTAQDLTDRQAGSFGEAKNRVMPVPPKPEMLNPVVAFTDPMAVIDHERQVDEYNAAAQRNVDVMNGYSGASEYNTTNLPTTYGTLSNDQAGVGVGTDSTTVDSADFADSGGSTSGEPGRRAGGSAGDSDRAAAGSPVTDAEPTDRRAGSPGPGGLAATPDITTPETFNPTPPGQPLTPADPGAGRTPIAPTGGLPPGVDALVAGPGTGGVGGAPRGGIGGGAGPVGGGAGPRGGVPGPGSGSAGPRGGAPGPGGGGAGPGGGSAGPRDGVPGPGGGGGGPRGGAPGPGGGAGSEPPGSSVRSASAASAVPGRGNPAMSGIPVGAAGRSRDDEDTERKRPEWLEGGDPDDLFDTDVLTAPSTIGAEDD